MSTSKTIRITEDVFLKLKSLKKFNQETPNMVLRRQFGLDEKKTKGSGWYDSKSAKNET